MTLPTPPCHNRPLPGCLGLGQGGVWAGGSLAELKARPAPMLLITSKMEKNKPRCFFEHFWHSEGEEFHSKCADFRSSSVSIRCLQQGGLLPLGVSSRQPGPQPLSLTCLPCTAGSSSQAKPWAAVPGSGSQEGRAPGHWLCSSARGLRLTAPPPFPLYLLPEAVAFASLWGPPPEEMRPQLCSGEGDS